MHVHTKLPWIFWLTLTAVVEEEGSVLLLPGDGGLGMTVGLARERNVGALLRHQIVAGARSIHNFRRH